MTQITANSLYTMTPLKQNVEKAEVAEANKEVPQNAQETSDLNKAPNYVYNQILVNKVTTKPSYPKNSKDNFRACLIGGAIGDAVGRPIERVRIGEIKNRYGEDGIQDMATVGMKGRFTDDTQMTIFTADGLIKSALKTGDTEEAPDYKTVYESYKDWYKTQTEGRKNEPEIMQDRGWIGKLDELYYPNGAGRTTLGAMESGIMGTPENPINNANSCGAVMRVAPAGLMYHEDPKMAFDVGVRCGAMTHSGAEAYLPAGVFAAMIAYIVQGETLENALDKSIDILKEYDQSEASAKLVKLLEDAKEYAKDDSLDHEVAIDKLGKGWRGDEALAITAYCVLKEPNDFKKAVLMAVNHDGDSDSTGAMVGNILGAHLGSDEIPQDWAENVEISEEIKELADDLHNPSEIENAKKKYTVE